jgi:type II secretory pathway pseudopilin PulG
MMSRSRPHKGFTLLEVTIVSGLMTFLALLLFAAWSGIGKSTLALITRCQLAQEMDFAVAALSRDLCGNMALKDAETDPARLGGKQNWRLLDWRIDPSTGYLELDFDGNPSDSTKWKPADKIVTYRWDPPTHTLIRADDTGSTFTVARNIESFSTYPDSSDSTMLHIELIFAYYYHWDSQRTLPIIKRTCKLVAKKT